ncbi:MAG: T9SS type A sorting domain-containing protein [Bacteroidia bacterium]|nr:T9SS type A sorting domain-containing protein [Bacteroidia bacterium]
MKKIILILISMVHLAAFSQVRPAFISIDDKNFKPIDAMILGENGELLTFSIDKYMGFAQAGMSISKWNGLFSAKLPIFNPEYFYFGNFNRTSICQLNDTIFAAGSFIQNNGKGIVKWNGNSWESVGGGIWSDYPVHPEISIEDILPFNNELFVCGIFNQTATGPCNGFVHLVNGQWENIPVNGLVKDLEVIGDTLFVGGSFNTINGVSASNCAYFTNGNWYALTDPGLGIISQIGQYNQQLVAIGETGIAVYKNGIWNSLSNAWNYTIEYKGTCANINNSLYISGDFKHLDGSVHHLLEWDGNQWHSLIQEANVSPKNMHKFFVCSNGKSLYFGGTIKTLFGEKVNNVVEIFPKHSIVRGRLYRDKNENCIFDLGDEILSNAVLSVDEGVYYSSTNADGFYEVALSPNSDHSIRVFPNNDETVLCGKEHVQIKTRASDTLIILDFALSKQPVPPSEYIHLYSDRGYVVKHGYDAHYTIDFSANDQHYPFILTLKHPSALTGFLSEQATIESKEGTVSWAIEYPQQIKFSFNINPVAFDIGDIIHFEVETIHPSGWKIKDELEQTVVSAYDPNDKQCSELKIGTGTRKLDYRIGFQNLGNDEAYNVYIVDTISRTMPLQFLKVNNYSHATNYKVSFKVRDHAVIWGFEDIRLGAKMMVGDILSSGFIEFSTGLENKLKIGDSITNQAAIYFDFQAPVFTNTVVTKVVTYTQTGNQLGLNLILYPNPNTGNFHINLEPYDILKAEIYDVSGRLVSSINGQKSGELEIFANGLAKGLYTIKVYHALGVISKQFVVVD